VTAKRKSSSARPGASRAKGASEPAGPSRDRERTRGDILGAACRGFATKGYAQSSVREIASQAGINPALVVRYFGSKRDLFVAALERDLQLEPFLAGARETLGRSIAESLLSKVPHEGDALAMMLLAATDPSLSATLKRILQRRLYGPLAEWLGGRHAESRAALLLAVVSGAWMYRQLLPVPPLTGKVDEPTLALLATTLQSLIDAPATPARR
jgi:AcrR family transcriptional regulator